MKLKGTSRDTAMGEARRRRKREEQRLASGTGTVAPENPPEPYSHMTAGEYWNMLIGEDPDDREIREAHGIGYEEDPGDLGVVCRYGCGATYHDISSGKRRTCPARREPKE